MKMFVTVAAMAALLITPSLARAQKVTTDFDDKAPFASYKTYRWTTGTPSPNPLGESRIHDAVEASMAKAGFTKAAGTPDVVIATHAIAKEQKELYTTGGYGYGARWGGGMSTTQVNTYVQGTLVLDMYDAKTKELAWRATGTDTMSDKADKNTTKVVKALDKMFKQYPPKKK